MENKQNEHHIYEIKNKKGLCFLVRISYQNNGDRKEIKKSFPVYKYGSRAKAFQAAKQWRDVKLVETHQNIIIQIEPKQVLTLDEVFERTIEARAKSFETNRKWRIWYKKYITSIIPGKTSFIEITWQDISKTLNSMVDDSSQDMIDRITTIWKKMCAYAIYYEVIIKNPMVMLEVEDKTESKKPSKQRDKRFNMDLFVEVLNEFPYRKNDPREAFLEMTVLIIMAYVGLRPAEVFMLSKSNFDLKNRTILIQTRLGSNTKEKHVETSLGNKGYGRYVPYPEQLDELIKVLIDTSPREELFYINGRYLNSDIVSSDINRISNGKFRSYMLRHAFANDLIIDKDNEEED